MHTFPLPNYTSPLYVTSELKKSERAQCCDLKNYVQVKFTTRHFTSLHIVVVSLANE